MNDVWVVVYDSIGWGEDMVPYGVFDSEEKAREFAAIQFNNHRIDIYRFKINEGVTVSIPIGEGRDGLND